MTKEHFYPLHSLDDETLFLQYKNKELPELISQLLTLTFHSPNNSQVDDLVAQLKYWHSHDISHDQTPLDDALVQVRGKRPNFC